MRDKPFVQLAFAELLRWAHLTLARLIVDLPLVAMMWGVGAWRAFGWLRPLAPGREGYGLTLIFAWVGAGLLGALAAACSMAVLQWDEEYPSHLLWRRAIVVVVAFLLLAGVPSPHAGRVIDSP